MEVLVTGATGYVGAAITDALLAAGHRVSGLVRSEESAERLKERGITTVKGDIADAASVRVAAREVEAVVHATTHGGGRGGGPDGHRGDPGRLRGHEPHVRVHQRGMGDGEGALGWSPSAPSIFEELERGSYA